MEETLGRMELSCKKKSFKTPTGWIKEEHQTVASGAPPSHEREDQTL